MQKIRKGIIPVAGFGTRFLPATKVFPKPMLPIIDKPILQYIVEEFVASGIEQIILVMDSENNLMRRHFETFKDLEDHLEKFEKFELLKSVRAISSMADFKFVVQNGPYGTATPVLNCEELIGGEPFVMAFGDDIIKSKVPAIRQMLDIFEQYQSPAVSTFAVPRSETYHYGVIDGEKVAERLYKVKQFVEKPKVEEAPSNLAVNSRYVLTPDIFPILKGLKAENKRELYLTSGVEILLKQRDFYACEIEGTYYDCGNKLEFLKAINAYALERDDLREDYTAYLKSLKL